MADRFFPGYKLWRAAAKTGADLLWRTRQNARLDVEKRLPDGSYLSRNSSVCGWRISPSAA